ncbi:MAG: YqaJ viral recombinase family protein [Clostridium sp.]|uniref:YqaJ viral recombinase family protein n=1 Tax=Clostridium sp. TaxID=1506 RepID=UPI00290DC1DC|nr:YqaJ viral recombinase family protein [Clostridium sp.]MDU7339346.1 YqaJ viral recombinase family protein [Clostridium sp.]
MNQPTNHNDWIKARRNGIGASEAAAVVGLSPYKSNTDLWEEKTGNRTAPDISNKPYILYGKEAEKHLRALFSLDFPQYQVYYDEFGMIRNNLDCPFAFATLDGELTETSTGKKGVLEIKTTEIMRSGQWDEWNNKIPQHYYIQVIHQLLATGYDFAVLKAQIKYRKDGVLTVAIRHYLIERVEVESDIQWLAEREKAFWKCVIEQKRPSLILPEI